MSIYDDLTRAIKEHDKQFQPKPIRQRGQLGYTINNVYSVPEPTDTAQYRVRLDNKSFVTAYHNGKCAPQPDLSVWVVQDELGRYHIDSVDVTNVSSSNPNNPSQAFTAPHSHGRGSGMEFPIDPRLFSPFQIRIISGLNVYINGGAYKYEGQWKWFGGDTIDLSSYVPVSASQQRWVVLAIDHPTSTITVMTGGTQSATSPLTIEQIESITMRGIPIGAIRLHYGQTTITETDLEALHILTDSFPKHNYTATTAPTVNDDELDGYGVSSSWYDQTSLVPYVCIDATAGAAIWVSGGGGGASVPISTAKETIYVRKLIFEQVLSVDGTFTIPIGANDDEIEIEAILQSNAVVAFDTIHMDVNGDTTDANYRQTGVQAAIGINNITGSNRIIGYCTGASSASTTYSYLKTEAINLKSTSVFKNFHTETVLSRDATANITSFIGSTWRNTSPVTSITIKPDGASDLFQQGSLCRAYRIRNIDVVTEVSGTQSELFPITLDYAETVPSNRQVVLSHINIVSGGSLEVNGAVVFTGGE